MNKIYLSILLSISCVFTFAQDELVIKGNNGTNPTLYVKGNDGTNPTLYVNGEINNDNGIFQSEDGDIELTGNWTNTVSAVNAKYESSGEVKFSNTTAASINGTMDGTANGVLASSGLNQFNELKINTNSSTVDITLNTDVNIHNTGNVNFIADGKIVTGANKLFVRNNTAAAITGYTFPGANTINGPNTRYIEGNLQRAVTSGTYDYPVGDANRMIPFRLENVNATADILGNVEDGAQTVSNAGYMYCDVATHPGTGSGQNLSMASSNTPDGIIDQMVVNLNSTKQWNADLISGSVTSYDIEVFPGDFDITSPYNSTLGDLRYLFKDGDLYSGGTALATASYPSAGFLQTGINGACPQASAYSITGLTSFSTFRIGGVGSSSGTLPVELISLNAYGVENKYITVDWKTATEVNNEGFEVQRSEDGISFKKIGFVSGNGNASEILSYSFNDETAQANIIYYYRLKQIDFDGNFELTYNVSASLNRGSSLSVSNFIPNPSSAASHIEVQVDNESEAYVVMYNGLGQAIVTERVALNKGLNILPFELNNLAAGIYQTTIVIGEDTYSRKLNLIK